MMFFNGFFSGTAVADRCSYCKTHDHDAKNLLRVQDAKETLIMLRHWHRAAGLSILRRRVARRSRDQHLDARITSGIRVAE